jgi:hypothetical protein
MIVASMSNKQMPHLHGEARDDAEVCDSAGIIGNSGRGHES